MLDEGQDQGVIKESEAEMISNIFDLDETSASEIMTHRKNICEKLNMKSVSALTIYAVTHGLVKIDEI